MNPSLTALAFRASQRLNLEYDELLSNVAFNGFISHPYTMDAQLRRIVTGGDDCCVAVTRLPLSLEAWPYTSPLPFSSSSTAYVVVFL